MSYIYFKVVRVPFKSEPSYVSLHIAPVLNSVEKKKTVRFKKVHLVRYYSRVVQAKLIL